jgi:hypothetical protein
MLEWINVTSNTNGIPYLKTSGVTVSASTVDFAIGFRRIPPIGYLTVNITDVIPSDATGTLPVRLVLNGNARNLTFFGGDNVTAADLTGTGIITVFFNWYEGILQLISPTSA